MERKIFKTEDGSFTVHDKKYNQKYHSSYGAFSESAYVFIENGLKHFSEYNSKQKTISILEAGFGTGLNLLLSADYCVQNKLSLKYTGIDAYPLNKDILKECNHGVFIKNKDIYESFLNNYTEILNGNGFALGKDINLNIKIIPIEDFLPAESPFAHIIYYDAFSPSVHAEAWSREVIKNAAACILPGGYFISYSITGKLKRNLTSFGFNVEKLPGALGKRNMIRAKKTADNKKTLK